MTNQHNKDWEKNFDKKFVKIVYKRLGLPPSGTVEIFDSLEDLPKDVKSFIKTLLKDHISRSEIQEVLSRMIEKHEENNKVTLGYATLKEAYDFGYNETLKEIKERLCK